MIKHPHPAIARREPIPIKGSKKQPKPPQRQEKKKEEKTCVPTLAELPVTVICTNYRTPKLVTVAVNSFHKFYPNVRIIVIDNGSDSDSVKAIKSLASNDNVDAMLLKKNIGHGPAMHQAIMKHVNTFYTFLLDSDTETVNGDFLERMIERLGTGYAIGWMRFVDSSSGVATDRTGGNNIKYIHPYASLIRTDVYKTLPPFNYHGAPCLDNMRAAGKQKYKLIPFDIQHYIKHLVAGTRRMWGGNWDIKQKAPTSEWEAGRTYPI